MTYPMSDLQMIHAIAHRAAELYQRLGLLKGNAAKFAKYGIAHEVLTVHREIMPLRLQEFMQADDGNFSHDIGGIHRHLDERGAMPRLTDCFVPRYAASQKA